MRIGDLRHRVTLQAETRTSDSLGGWVVTWVDIATVWAAVWPVSATEQIQAAQPVMTISHRVRMRFRPNVKASWRIKFGERYFNIVSIVNPNEAGVMLDVLCKEAAS